MSRTDKLEQMRTAAFEAICHYYDCAQNGTPVSSLAPSMAFWGAVHSMACSELMLGEPYPDVDRIDPQDPNDLDAGP